MRPHHGLPGYIGILLKRYQKLSSSGGRRTRGLPLSTGEVPALMGRRKGPSAAPSSPFLALVPAPFEWLLEFGWFPVGG